MRVHEWQRHHSFSAITVAMWIPLVAMFGCDTQSSPPQSPVPPTIRISTDASVAFTDSASGTVIVPPGMVMQRAFNVISRVDLTNARVLSSCDCTGVSFHRTADEVADKYQLLCRFEGSDTADYSNVSVTLSCAQLESPITIPFSVVTDASLRSHTAWLTPEVLNVSESDVQYSADLTCGPGIDTSQICVDQQDIPFDVNVVASVSDDSISNRRGSQRRQQFLEQSAELVLSNFDYDEMEPTTRVPIVFSRDAASGETLLKFLEVRFERRERLSVTPHVVRLDANDGFSQFSVTLRATELPHSQPIVHSRHDWVIDISQEQAEPVWKILGHWPDSSGPIPQLSSIECITDEDSIAIPILVEN